MMELDMKMMAPDRKMLVLSKKTPHLMFQNQKLDKQVLEKSRQCNRIRMKLLTSQDSSRYKSYRNEVNREIRPCEVESGSIFQLVGDKFLIAKQKLFKLL